MQFETTLAAVHKLQGAIKELKYLMSNSALQRIDRIVKYTAAFSEVSILSTL